jgi:trigger factor
MINDFSVRMSYSGIKFEDYLKYIGSDLEKFKEEHKIEALESVKARLVLEAIIRKENISVEKEEVDSEVQKIAEQEGKDIETVKKDLKENQISRIMNKIIGDKLFDFLRKNNKFK